MNRFLDFLIDIAVSLAFAVAEMIDWLGEKFAKKPSSYTDYRL
jgi:hypothetical protein